MTCQRFHTVSRMRENCTYGSMRGRAYPAGASRPTLLPAANAVGKSLGSKNRLNVVKATLNALSKLRSAEEIAAIRA